MTVLDLLLYSDTPNVAKELPTKQFEVPRLSRLAGDPVIFTLRALPYGRVQDIRRMADSEQEAQIVLQGCADPNLKDPQLMAKYDAATPVDALYSLLLPGEIADLSLEVERLSGYRRRTIEEVKNA